MTELTPLPAVLLEPIIRAALTKDLGRAGDITTNAVVPAEAMFSSAVMARQDRVVAGTQAARIAFDLVDPGVGVNLVRPDGSPVAAGETIMTIEGPARAVLTGERTALNNDVPPFGHRQRHGGIGRCRGEQQGAYHLHPENHAVRAGGGVSHRFGLDDGILIKDNHVALAGGIRLARVNLGHMVKIEIEVDTLEQLDEALSEGVDAVLLDNMGPDMLHQAVETIDGRAISEASGRITHSAPSLDLGLDHGEAA